MPALQRLSHAEIPWFTTAQPRRVCSHFPASAVALSLASFSLASLALSHGESSGIGAYPICVDAVARSIMRSDGIWYRAHLDRITPLCSGVCADLRDARGLGYSAPS